MFEAKRSGSLKSIRPQGAGAAGWTPCGRIWIESSACIVSLALGVLAVFTACDGKTKTKSPDFEQVVSNKPYDNQPQIEPSEAESIATGNQALSFDLYHAVRESDGAERGFSVSALSLESVFGMVWGGTVEPAHGEMATTMHFSLPDDRQHVALNWRDAELASRNLEATQGASAVKLHNAKGVWVLEKYADLISPDYLDLLAVSYDAGVYLARFDSKPEIERGKLNAWVAERTANLIPMLFPPGSIDVDTALVLVNALYLEAPWASPFDADATAKAPFYRLDGSEVEVDMMNQFDLSGDYAKGAGYEAIALPLRGDALELLIVMPEDFPSFEDQLDRSRLAAIRDGMQPAIVTTSLPKFRLKSELELTDELKSLGMKAPFVDDHSFDRIVEKLGVITTVVQQTVIDVDERGVEAAAATGAVISVTSAVEPTAEIVVDRPFILAIRDKPTDTLLFLGRVLDPTE